MDFLGDSDGTRLASGLAWLNAPRQWSVDDGMLTISADPKTDFFQGLEGFDNDSACLLHRQVAGDFTLRAFVEADHQAFGDAGCLTLRHDPTHWAKLCLERSPIGDLNVVSVVTRATSDDCTSELVAEPRRHLRISCKGNEFAFHHSADGGTWRFVRFFLLDVPETISVGVHAQSPFGDGVTARFRGIELLDTPVPDYRSGE
jgi:regulation of enolase protein 1 (concanavalin A-like superfamily)